MSSNYGFTPKALVVAEQWIPPFERAHILHGVNPATLHVGFTMVYSETEDRPAIGFTVLEITSQGVLLGLPEELGPTEQ